MPCHSNKPIPHLHTYCLHNRDRNKAAATKEDATDLHRFVSLPALVFRSGNSRSRIFFLGLTSCKGGLEYLKKESTVADMHMVQQQQQVTNPHIQHTDKNRQGHLFSALSWTTDLQAAAPPAHTLPCSLWTPAGRDHPSKGRQCGCTLIANQGEHLLTTPS
jgi:hypothetical protein